MADLDAQVPQRVQQAIDQRTQGGTRLARHHHVAFMQKHDVDVAVRIQFGPAVPADGDQGADGRGYLGQVGRGTPHGINDIAQEKVDDGGAGAADFAPFASGAVEDFEAVRLHLEEVLVADQFLAGLGMGWENQARGGAGLNFLEQSRHPASG